MHTVKGRSQQTEEAFKRTKNMTVLSLFVVLTHVLFVFGDVYMHNPRGSNDRNCERNVNRNNGNRLFNR